MKTRGICFLMAGLALVTLTGGCATGRRGSVYVPADEEGVATAGIDMRDTQLVVERMTASMLRQGLKTEAGKRPVITLGPLHNRSPYRVDTRMIGEDLRVAVMKSGQARFTMATDHERNGDESGILYKQLAFQNESGHVRPDTAKAYGQIVGADYILYGNIYGTEHTGRDTRGRRIREVNLRFTLTLAEVESGLAVWSDTQSLRKAIPR